MVQGDLKSKKPSSVVPEKKEYTGRERNVKKGGPREAALTPGFAAALPGMIKTAEAIAASRLTRSGAKIRLNEIKELASEEIKMKAEANRKRNYVSEVLSRTRNVKGVRGEFDAEELAKLDPELKAILDKRHVSQGGKPKKSADESNDLARVSLDDSSLTNAKGSSKGVKRLKTAQHGKVASLENAGAADDKDSNLFSSNEQISTAFGEDFL